MTAKTPPASKAPRRTHHTGQPEFYTAVIRELLAAGTLSREMRLLVVCAGEQDKAVLEALDLCNLTFSNLDERQQGRDFSPHNWSYQDVEHLGFADDSFDFCIVQNGLHHCYSPHHGLLEMFRVARLGIVVIEPFDCLLTRLAARWGAGQEYETSAVAGNGLRYGGVANTDIPNFVYRWSARDVEKTVKSFAPWGRHQFRYFHQLLIPARFSQQTGLLRRGLAAVAVAGLRLFHLFFPRQTNVFAFAVLRASLAGGLLPWLELRDGRPAARLDWFRGHYPDCQELAPLVSNAKGR